MWLDALVLGILALFALLGALKGALQSALALLSLAAAYAAAVAVAKAVGADDLTLVAAAGSGAFLGTWVALGLLARALRRWERARLDGGGRSPRDRFLGGVFGALRGALVCLLLGLLAIWLDLLRTTGTAEVVPPLEGSSAAALTASVVEAGVGAALADSGPGGRLVARAVARPAATWADVQAVVAHPAITALTDDRVFWANVEHGAVDTALNQGSFLAITYDPDLRTRLAELGFLSPAAAADPRAFRAAAAAVLHEIGPRMRSLREDPELRRLLEDPQIVAALRAGDTFTLVRVPEFRRLVTRVTAGGAI